MNMAAEGNSESAADSVTTHFNTVKDYIPISYNDSLLLDGFYHAAHCMIYAKWNAKLFKQYNPRAAVLMQLRFDGQIGFPGGIVNHGESPVDGVNREMHEEINLDLSKHRATDKSHVISHVNHKIRLVTHFFVLEVNLDDYKIIEKRCLDAEDYGEESLGVLRACLYTMKDNVRGFPSFLKNNFVGNCKEQLCHGLRSCSIMTEQEIRAGLSLSNDINK